MNGQDDKFKKNMKSSQVEWVKYKEKYLTAIASFYRQQEGTLWGVTAAEARMNITRDKTLDLYRLRNSTNMEG